MIELLQNSDTEMAEQIRAVFQSSYKVEATILGVEDFPPLRRPVEHFIENSNQFFGCFQNGALAGVIEIELHNDFVDINSLVVDPRFFRQGIARRLLQFVLDQFDSEYFIVETGLENEPATNLYKQFGFQEVEQWDTDFGVRKVKFKRGK